MGEVLRFFLSKFCKLNRYSRVSEVAVRNELKQMNNQRLRFTATIERFGERKNFKGVPTPTILLKNIRLVGEDKILTDHLWFTKGTSWINIPLGSVIEFDARISEYTKGYKGHRKDVVDAPITTDYKLTRPTNIVVR